MKPSDLKPSDLTPAMQEYLLLADRITRMSKNNCSIYFPLWALGREQTGNALVRRGLLTPRVGGSNLYWINAHGMALAHQIRRERQEAEQ